MQTWQKTTAEKIYTLCARKSIQVLLISGFILLCYAHTLDVPFYLDDNGSLRNNPAIQGIHWDRLWQTYSARIVGYLTFAINFTLHGYEVAGYHIFNIAVHLLTTLVVFLISSLLFSTPALAGKTNESVKIWFPLLAAIIFAIHPLHTQAITYIVQRLASLAALFYLISMYSYIKGRLSPVIHQQVLYFLLSGLCFVLAFSTKQNAITAPLALFIIELCFFGISARKCLVAAGVLGCFLLLGFILSPIVLKQSFYEFVDARTRETLLFSRAEYFSVQMHVLWEYVFKFLFPVNLTLNYENPVPVGLWNAATSLKALLHLSALITAILIVKRAPVPAFGILFYYCAHIVESTIIPIRDFGFDHRTYLPDFGLCLIAGWLLASLAAKKIHQKIPWIIAIYIIVLAGLTWQRNDLWRHPVAFFSHEARVSADSFRAHCLLGQAYYEEKNIEQAITTFQQAWPLRANLIDRGNNTFTSCATNFAATLQEGGQLEEARTLIMSLPLSTFPNFDRSKLTGILGNIAALNGNYPEAEELFSQARELDPGNIDAISNLAKLKILTDELDESYELFRLVNQLDPNDRDGIIGLQYLEGIRNEQQEQEQ